MSVEIAAFYKFVSIEDGASLKARLAALGCANGLKGTVLIAPEGINATVSAEAGGLATFLEALEDDARFSGLPVKLSRAPAHPFQRFKVRLKREIITLGVPEANPALRAGTYVKPESWNALISDPDVVVLDTRNDYEVAIGSFERAIDPGLASFGRFPEFVQNNLDPGKHPRVAMFCTGGIRCEKASAYMLAQGFSEVYHLEGGILKYLETVPAEESLWRGECFVFDERVALGHGVEIGSHGMCPGCGRAVPKASPQDKPYCPTCAGATNR